MRDGGESIEQMEHLENLYFTLSMAAAASNSTHDKLNVCTRTRQVTVAVKTTVDLQQTKGMEWYTRV